MKTNPQSDGSVFSRDGRIGLLESASALVDGQALSSEVEAAIAFVSNDPAGREAWNQYHLIGDIMRSSDLARTELNGMAVVESVMRRLETEPVFITSVGAVAPVRGVTPGAANDAWGWKLLAGMASVSFVLAVAWNFFAPPSTDGAAVAAAGQSLPATVAASQEPVMIRDPHLDELLAAHKQFGGTSALQAPAGFLRNATFEVPGR